jgi:hypothetical protein
MIYMELLPWVGFGLMGYVPNTLYTMSFVLLKARERPKLIINVNPFLSISHRNFNPNLCLSFSIMYPHREL